MIDFFPSRAVAVDLFGFAVHWYGLLYLLAFLIGWVLLPRLQKYRGLNLSKETWADLLSWGVIGVIVGGRLGFVFFYEPEYFLQYPWKIFAVWEGGMASHGGFIGVTLALWHVLRRKRLPFLAIGDIVVVAVAIGLACGRFGNFINQELYGTVTQLPWGIEIPGVEGLRHPTPLYAMIKDLFIALVCYLHLRRPGSIHGRTTALFLMLYGVLRFLVEYVRVQEYPLVPVPFFLSMGQVLTIPIFLIGAWLWVYSGRRAASPSATAI